MAVIGGFRSDLSITPKTDGNIGNVSAGVFFFKVAYQRKLAILPTGYGKSLIFQSFVVAKELLNSAKACVLVLCPLTSITQDQIAEAKALWITCVSPTTYKRLSKILFRPRALQTRSDFPSHCFNANPIFSHCFGRL